MGERTYTPGGKGQRLLAHLDIGPASFADLCAALQVTQQKFRMKTFMTLSALRQDGLVRRQGPETYVLTVEGSDALHRLRAGHPVITQAVPSVRVFGRAAA